MPAIRLSVNIEDGYGFETTTNAFINAPIGATLTQLSAAVNTWLGLLNNVTAGKINSCNASLGVVLSGFSVNDPADTNLDPAGALKFPKTTADGPWDFIIPDVLASVRLGNKLVMTEGGAVDLLADKMEAGFTVITGADATFTTRYGHNLTGPADSFLSKRHLIRGIRGKSYGVGV